MCGKHNENENKVSNTPDLVDCPECSIKLKICCICGCIVNDDQVSNNEFFIACKEHKEKAELLTTIFFEEYPDITKWENIIASDLISFYEQNIENIKKQNGIL